MDKQLATIIKSITTPPIKNRSEHPTHDQKLATHSPDNSKAGNSRQLSIMLSKSPDTDNVYVPVVAIFPVIPSANVIMYPMMFHMFDATNRMMQ